MSATDSVEKRQQREEFLPFLTAWDPSDLPGGSVDPLGFDRGYNALSDKILPGLTNVAALPRYFGVLCAGALLGPDTTMPSRAEILTRQDCVVRLERLWALSQVLAAVPGGPSASGVRGVTYAEAHRDHLDREGRRSSSAEFKLLSRQVQYGVLGIYGNVAHGLRLIDRRTLGLSGDYGEALGRSFLEETGAPSRLKSAVQDPSTEVGLDSLRAWGGRAHLAGPFGPGEARVLGQALRLDRVRARMAEALQKRPARSGESELERLERIAANLGKADEDLSEAIEAIVAFEACYAWALLAFERVLWRCNRSGSVSVTALSADDVIRRCARSAPAAVARLEGAVEGARTEGFRKDLGRLDDIRAFLGGLSGGAANPTSLVEGVLGRHADVQHGKLDRGRRKLSWVELVDGSAVLTLARSPQVGREPRRTEDIAPHAYRTTSADALIQAEQGAKA